MATTLSMTRINLNLRPGKPHSDLPSLARGRQAPTVQRSISRAQVLFEIFLLCVAWGLNPAPAIPDSGSCACKLHSAAGLDSGGCCCLEVCLKVGVVCWAVHAAEHLCCCGQGDVCILQASSMTVTVGHAKCIAC